MLWLYGAHVGQKRLDGVLGVEEGLQPVVVGLVLHDGRAVMGGAGAVGGHVLEPILAVDVQIKGFEQCVARQRGIQSLAVPAVQGQIPPSGPLDHRQAIGGQAAAEHRLKAFAVGHENSS